MKIIRLLFFLHFYCLFSQEQHPISTAFPFLLISTDAVGSGKGDLGVASKPDVFSQYWNAAKYVFAQEESSVGMGYTPYLNKVVRDIFLGNLSYYKKINRGAWAGSFRYFSIGEVTLTQSFGNEAYVLGNFRPSEFAFDVSYSLKLNESFAMGVATRFLNSNLRLPTDDNITARGLAFDISGYYHSKEHLIGNYFGKYTLGFQISNIGSKVKYEDLGKTFFIPTNLKAGAGYLVSVDSYNTFNFLLEFNKLLVPTSSQNSENIDFLQGILKSFSDAPNGVSEEFQEISWALGGEYAYNESLFLRAGYFNQYKNKGDRKYLTVGSGFKVKAWQLDFSYLFSTARTHNPLSSSLRIALQYTL
ncbi:MAG: type IX secretion system outer membrane channel protein PorV [Capnocytophaga sp.]|nr:type IX secretion system outer membrane channel protein PorV [Capnocytophaga sp.]